MKKHDFERNTFHYIYRKRNARSNHVQLRGGRDFCTYLPELGVRLQKKYVQLLRFFNESHKQCNYSILMITQSRKGCSIRIESIVDDLERKKGNRNIFRNN